MAEYWKVTRLSEKSSPPLFGEWSPGHPARGQVLVRFRAAALNFADLLMQQGRYQDMPEYPFIPGLEGAGEVLEAGPGVELAVGTRVAVFSQGTMTEANIVPAAHCIPIPDSMTDAEAAGFLIAYGTSHMALTRRAGLRTGETLAVLGAGGGVGLTAVEIGAALGARVIAVARGADKAAALRSAGADEVIDSESCGDLRRALKELGGVDIVYDPVGGRSGEAAFGAIRPGGRFLSIGFAAGEPPALPLNHALVKNIAIHGFYWGGYRKLAPEVMQQDLSDLMRLYAKGSLKPQIGATLPLARLDEAYELMRSRQVVGKIIVTI
ncbi:NADPH:quinone oxidoreductase family protein [Paracoccus ravus]|uniref:NADPH:quinone oxidoreductase family protein n=1 Tax=Paracoccus ravus TaxID=2447760 RepID=UPI00106E2DE2|nr:NADPH:quinone oxidoreductase family protein [Paracoccus ravus]